MLSVRNLTKIYKLSKNKGSGTVVALNGVNIDFPETGLVFLLGKSGSGKSTLLNSIGGLDTFDDGEIIIKGKSSRDFKQSDFDSYRNTFIGFIFQEYNILEEFTVGKNLALALELQGKKPNKSEVEDLLEKVDLKGFYKRKPNQLSGGQKQRIAIARALIKDPEIIMADEPTGALDSNTGRQVMDTLKKLSKTKLVIIVSHDREFAEIYGDRIIELKDGVVISDQSKKEIEPEKSASGVSFIEDKIIHIKKGQKLTKEDLLKINRLIVNNKDSDTIISLDAKSNTEVKHAAAITDEGNREVFKQTKPEDINKKEYNPKDFKLIKSRLKFKDSFKMGASSLKHKPIRLIFTILLACIAFCMFGIVDTMASFNRATSVHESLNMLNVKTYAINKSVMDDYGYKTDNLPLSNQDISKMESKTNGHIFQKVIASGYDYKILNPNISYYEGSYGFNSVTNERKTLKQTIVSGITSINNDTINTFKLEKLYGELPVNDDEICISSNMYKTIVERIDEIDSFNDLKDKKIKISSDYYREDFEGTFKIVGVIKDDTDVSKYENNNNESSSGNMIGNALDEYEVQTVLSYGLINMCYVNNACFNKLVDDYSPTSDINYSYRLSDGGSYSLRESEFYTNEQFNDYYGSSYNVWTNNTDRTRLTGSQAIVGERVINNILYGWNNDGADGDIQAAIKRGMKITFNYGYSSQKAFELEVVGYISGEYTTSDIIVSSELKEQLKFTGVDYVVTRSVGGNADKALINYVENYKEGANALSIQFAATPMFDNFGSIISSMTKPLLYIGIGLAVFAGFMLMNFIATSISYKKREIGVLRAIGARGNDVFFIFFWESFVICVINFILAAIGCGIACFFINRSLLTQLGFTITLLSFGVRQLLLMFGVSFGVAVISSFLPVFKIARKNPIDSINNR